MLLCVVLANIILNTSGFAGGGNIAVNDKYINRMADCTMYVHVVIDPQTTRHTVRS